MTLIGPRPEKAPGLTNYPECDRRVGAAASELWGDSDRHAVKEHRLGKGRVLWGVTPREVLTRDGVGPDFEHTGGQPDTFIDWIHRSAGADDIYFLANRNDRPEQVKASFRVAGKTAEIWDPITGEVWNAGGVVQTGSNTSMPLTLPPYGSLFVLFRKAAAQKPAKTRRPEQLSVAAKVEGPWTVRFDPKWGGPESVVFEDLIDWTKHADEGIKYYSGSATYSTSFQYGGQKGPAFLDLGDVKEIAEVRLNGRSLGVAWTKPFRVDATPALRAGENKLEIEMVNLWPNRLIRDAQLPPDRRLTSTNVKVYSEPKPEGHPLLSSGLLGPVRVMVAGPEPV
jgi:hypothetical protein